LAEALELAARLESQLTFGEDIQLTLEMDCKRATDGYLTALAQAAERAASSAGDDRAEDQRTAQQVRSPTRRLRRELRRLDTGRLLHQPAPR
jgi:hypothetical protein